jgi:hypothetical protein
MDGINDEEIEGKRSLEGEHLKKEERGSIVM